MRKRAGILYGVDERAPFGVVVLSALQHVGLISVFLLFPLLVCREARLSPDEVLDVLSLSMLAMSDLRISYAGPPLDLPDKRPTNEEIIASEEGQRGLAGFMLRRYADRVSSTHRAGRSTILFHFDH